MMRGWQSVLVAVCSAAGFLHHEGSSPSFLQHHLIRAQPVEVAGLPPDPCKTQGGLSNVDRTASEVIRPACAECTDPEQDPHTCCEGQLPSSLKQCTTLLPQSLKVRYNIPDSIWEGYHTSGCNAEGELRVCQLNGGKGMYCDPCRPQGTVTKGGDGPPQSKALYCERGTGKTDWLNCFPATPEHKKFTCVPQPENDVFGGWELQDQGQAGMPVCSKAATKWNEQYQQQHDRVTHRMRHTWVADKMFTCGTGGNKDTSGTDYCHNDYCTYPPMHDDVAAHTSDRTPWADFQSCEDAYEKQPTLCTDSTQRALQFQNGCKKTCRVCSPNSAPSPGMAEQQEHVLDQFDICNRITAYGEGGYGQLENPMREVPPGEGGCHKFTNNATFCTRSYTTTTKNGHTLHHICKTSEEDSTLCVESDGYFCGFQGNATALMESHSPDCEICESARKAADLDVELAARMMNKFPPDAGMACSKGGHKDPSGTDHCHDDYCVYEDEENGQPLPPDNSRHPFSTFTSCAAVRSDERCRELNFQHGCRKTCGNCTATKPDVPHDRTNVTLRPDE